MIPNKNKTRKDNSVEAQAARLDWAARHPTSDLQKLAQKENFALFQLEGIKSQLRSIEWGLISNKDKVIAKTVLEIKDSVEFLKTSIKCIQSDRKRSRKKGIQG